MASATRTTRAISATSWTRTICAPPKNRRGDCRGRAQQSLVRRHIRFARPRHRLCPETISARFRSRSDNPGARIPEAAREFQNSVRAFSQIRCRDPARFAISRGPLSLRAPRASRKPAITSRITSRANGPRCIVPGRAAHVHQDHGRVARGAQLRRVADRCAGAEISFRISAPAASAALATSAFCVSTDMGMRSLPRKTSITGRIRRSSSSAGTARRRAAWIRPRCRECPRRPRSS